MDEVSFVQRSCRDCSTSIRTGFPEDIVGERRQLRSTKLSMFELIFFPRTSLANEVHIVERSSELIYKTELAEDFVG